jgi:hypothetical protein
MSTNLSAPIAATNESSNKRPRDEDSGITAAGPEAEGDDGEGDAWTWDDLKELYERAMTSYTAGSSFFSPCFLPLPSFPFVRSRRESPADKFCCSDNAML